MSEHWMKPFLFLGVMLGFGLLGCSDEPSQVFTSCDDGIVSGQETDVDCGGGTCEPCDLGWSCLLDRDCVSDRCLDGECVLSGELCGNGKQDPGETCDGDCPASCNDSDDCTSDLLSGSAEECTAECIYSPITSCTDGDGCCPTDCTFANDNDCVDETFALRFNAGSETGISIFDGKEFEPLRPYLTAGTAASSSAGIGIPALLHYMWVENVA